MWIKIKSWMVPSESTVKEDGDKVIKKGRNMFYFNYFLV